MARHAHHTHTHLHLQTRIKSNPKLGLKKERKRPMVTTTSNRGEKKKGSRGEVKEHRGRGLTRLSVRPRALPLAGDCRRIRQSLGGPA